MAKYLFTDLTTSNATYQVNPQDFFNKALLGKNRSTNNFRTLVNVKATVKLGSLEFGSVLGAQSVTFATTGNAVLSAKTFTVTDISINTEFDQYTLEQSFIAQWMRQGSNIIDFGPAQFMDQYYERLSSRVSNDLELLTWQGDTALTGVTSLKLVDGLEKQLKVANEPTAIAVAAPIASITPSNVLSAMSQVILALPTALKYRKDELAFMVSPNVAQAYEIAAASLNTSANVTQSLGLMYQGIKVIPCDGLSANKMTISLGDNYVFATDLLSDDKEIITIEMKATTGDRTIRTISDIKFAVGYVNAPEIVTYNFG